MFQRNASPAARPTPAPTLRRDSFDGGTVREALDSLEVQIARIEEWSRRFGRDHDQAGTHRLAIEELKVVADRLRRVGADTRPLFAEGDRRGRPEEPLVRMGQGTYTREFHGNPRTGKLNVKA